MDLVYTTCEVGKRRSVNHTCARSLTSPSQAEAEAEGMGVARRGAARPDGRCVCVCVARPDVTCRCGAVRRDVLR